MDSNFEIHGFQSKSTDFLNQKYISFRPVIMVVLTRDQQQHALQSQWSEVVLTARQESTETIAVHSK